MAQRGRKRHAHHARRAALANGELDDDFYKLAEGAIEWLDHGNYQAFSDALDALDNTYISEVAPVDPDAPRDERVRRLASRYVAAVRALADLRLIQSLIEERRDTARAELIAAASEPSPVPTYWQTLINRIRAEGIRQPDVHPSSWRLARHLASAIRDFNATSFDDVDDENGDVPISAWDQLPRTFAGFTLVDVDLRDHPVLRTPCPLPPSTDIAFFTADGRRPGLLSNRHDTYAAWFKIIEDWSERYSKAVSNHHQAVWAMLLAYRIDDDASDVTFFHDFPVESPWEPGKHVMIKAVEDDVPSF